MKKVVSVALFLIMTATLMIAAMTSVSAAYLFEETFEDDKLEDRGWELPEGKSFPLFNKEAPHEGSGSLMIDSMANQSMTNYKDFERVFIEIWFYDDPAIIGMDAMMLIYDDISEIVGAGVRDSTSQTNYCSRIGADWAVTEIARTKGWHKFTWDFTSGTKADVYIDGVLAATKEGSAAVTQIALGNFWNLTGPAKFYFDDIRVYEPGNEPVEAVAEPETVAEETPAEPASETVPVAPQTGDNVFTVFVLIAASIIACGIVYSVSKKRI